MTECKNCQAQLTPLAAPTKICTPCWWKTAGWESYRGGPGPTRGWVSKGKRR